MNNYDYDGLKRINKKTARKLFNNGKKIRICMNKVHPKNIWHLYTDIERPENTPYTIYSDTEYNTELTTNDFDTIVNGFEFYNTCYENGYYASFYLIEK